MRCYVSSCQVEESGEYPSGICRKSVGTNSIQCTGCVSWIHKRCCEVVFKLQDVDASVYPCLQCGGSGDVGANACFHVGHGR